MASKEIKTEEVANWLTPREAIQLLEPSFGTDSHSYIAKRALLERLRGPQIRAAATVALPFAPEQTKSYEIDASDWTNIDEDDLLWTTGDMVFEWTTGSGYYIERHTTRHYRVRLDPVGVRAMLPPERLTPAVTSQSSAPDTQPAGEKGPPVAAAHLAAWYEAYRKIYGGTPADTEPNAVASARAMFPGKLVSREAVRKVRGSQKPGPKSPQNSG